MKRRGFLKSFLGALGVATVVVNDRLKAEEPAAQPLVDAVESLGLPEDTPAPLEGATIVDTSTQQPIAASFVREEVTAQAKLALEERLRTQAYCPHSLAVGDRVYGQVVGAQFISGRLYGECQLCHQERIYSPGMEKALIAPEVDGDAFDIYFGEYIKHGYMGRAYGGE